MTNAELPALKPVQVTKVSDDIRSLRDGDVAQQKTILTARAIADIFKCDTISLEKSTDVGYFVTRTVYNPTTLEDETRQLVDLDKVIYGGRKALEYDGYVNGPTNTKCASFLEIFSILSDERLQWTKPESEYKPFNIPDDQDQTTVHEPGIPFSPHIRQVLWANEVNWTRTGILIDAVNGIYEWSMWESLNNRRLHVVITDSTSVNSDGSQYTPDKPLVASPNTVYEIYTNVPFFTLPPADLFALGTMISVYQYPEQGEKQGDHFITLSATGVSYTEEYYDTGTGETITNHQFINCIPAVERNTKTINDIVKTDHLVAAQYDFEVVALVDSENSEFIPGSDPQVIRHTWELMVSNEETDFMSGLAELLNEHTDNYIRDMVRYANRVYREDPGCANRTDLQHASEPLIINRVISTSGYMKCSVMREKNGPGTWSVKCQLADAKRTGNFQLVTTKYSVDNGDGTTSEVVSIPDPDTVYYTLAGAELYVLARDPNDPTKPAGFLTAFDPDIPYFTLNVSNLTDYTDEIVAFNAANTHIGANTAYRYVYRNQILQIIITPSPDGSVTHRTLRDAADGEGVVHPMVEFFPDPHHSYISKAHLNTKAFTEKQVQDAMANGDLPTSQDEDKRDYPAATSALIEMYNYLVGKLQARGLMFGAVTRASLEHDDESLLTANLVLDTYTSDGTYWVCPKMLVGTIEDRVSVGTKFPFNGEYFARDDVNKTYVSIGYRKTTELIANYCPDVEHFGQLYIGVADPSLGWPTGITNDDCRIVVQTNERASGNMLEDGEEGTNGVVKYEATEVTQILTQVGTQTNIWIRTAKGKTGSRWNWGAWLKIFLNKFTVSYVNYEGDSIPASVIAGELAKGEPHISVGRSPAYAPSGTTTITVELPDPTQYVPGTKLTLELHGNRYVKMLVKYSKTNGSDPSELYQHTLEMPADKADNDLDSYVENWECDGSYWYLETLG